MARAKQTAARVQADLESLSAELEREVAALEGSYDAQAEELTEIEVKAKTTDIHVPFIGLVWMPYRKSGKGRLEPAWD